MTQTSTLILEHGDRVYRWEVIDDHPQYFGPFLRLHTTESQVLDVPVTDELLVQLQQLKEQT